MSSPHHEDAILRESPLRRRPLSLIRFDFQVSKNVALQSSDAAIPLNVTFLMHVGSLSFQPGVKEE
jgi:hypothetical protein